MSTATKTAFSGTIPEHYERHLGPVIFEPFAIDLAARLPQRPGLRVLEIAAGSGRVTRHLLQNLPQDTRLTVTDLNPDMLALAQETIDDPRCQWQVADATDLTFGEGEFDVVVAAFGVMFYPDRARAHREALRVLKPGGMYLFNVWGSHDQNPWAGIVQRVMGERYPSDPPQFFKKPFSCANREEMVRDVESAGFRLNRAEWVRVDTTAESAKSLAVGAIAGTPLTGEIAARDGQEEEATQHLAGELRQAFGDQPLKMPAEALIVEATKA